MTDTLFFIKNLYISKLLPEPVLSDGLAQHIQIKTHQT